MRGRRSQLVADRAQYPDTRRQREPVAIDDVIELAEQRRGLVVGQIELHAPNVGALTLFAESTVGASGNIGESQSATGTFFLCSRAILANFWTAWLESFNKRLIR